MNNERSSRYKIILIEPSQIIAKGVVAVFASIGKYDIVAQISDLSGYDRIKSIRHDIILIDPIVMSYSQQADVRSLFSEDDNSVLIALTYLQYDDSAMRQYDGRISLFDNPAHISAILSAVIESSDLESHSKTNGLSTRERDILAQVARGLTNKEIADYFDISVNTVVSHRKNISHKLGIKSTSGLTVYAIMNKLIDTSDLR